MASVYKLDATRNTGKHTKQSYIRCMQINLQHSKVVTANLMRITKEERTDILCIQEPYTIQNKVVGIPNKFRTYRLARTRSRKAIVVTNKHIDVVLLKQHSDTDAIVAEITVDGVKLIMASMYCDIGRPIEEDLSKI